MQVMYLGRAPRTKETLPDFLKWRRVTRPPLVFRGLTGSQRTPGFWGVTMQARENVGTACGVRQRKPEKSAAHKYINTRNLTKSNVHWRFFQRVTKF